MAQIMDTKMTEITMEQTDTQTGEVRSVALGTDLEFSDWWNTQQLIALHGQWFRYNTSSKQWMVWDGKRWTNDDRTKIEYLAKLTVRALYQTAADETDDKRRMKIAKHALKTENVGKIKAMVEMAKSEQGVSITANDLDRNDWLLNCQNCTIDLNVVNWENYDDDYNVSYNVVTKPHDPNDLITRCIPVDYDPSAECPVWWQFIRTVCGSDDLLMQYLQRAVGYSLTGLNREQCMFFCYGFGANGKSTFINIICQLLGEYTKNAQPDTFMRSDTGAIRTDVARLKGARLVRASETDEGKRLAESLVKQMTGEDTITARFLYGEEFEFTPTFKVWMIGNHKPQIRGADNGIWRRIQLVPFTVTIADKDKDKDLTAKLSLELPGILNWALQGLQMYCEKGLQPPKAVTDATKAYRSEMDHLGNFLAECIKKQEGTNTFLTDIYETYSKWCKSNGEWTMTSRELTRRMEERGFQKKKFNIGRAWIDVTTINQ